MDLKKQRYIIGHRSHMDFQLLNVQKLRMISIMMKIISITKRVIGKLWRLSAEIKNNSLFAYALVLLKRLPDESSRKSLIRTVETVISESKDDIDLNLIGFPENYLEIMKNSL